MQTFGDTTLEDKGIHVHSNQVDNNNAVVIGKNVRIHRADTDGTLF